MPRNPALSEAIALASSRRAECNTTLAEAARALATSESALSALGTAALIVDVRAQRDRWDVVLHELRTAMWVEEPRYGAAILPTKTCIQCDGLGYHNKIVDRTFCAVPCRTCNGSGYTP